MKIKKFRIFLFFLISIIIGISTLIIVGIARGYKFDFSQKTLHPTGLLVASSIPDGAQVFINGKLKTATNSTINLPPGEYEIEIKKEGYSTWKKTLKIQKELVTQTDAYLFATFPDLRVLTFTGAQKPLLSPDGTKVVYAVDTPLVPKTKQGLWILDLGERPLGLGREPRQIVANTEEKNFSQAELLWSPNSKQILATFKTVVGKGKTAKIKMENFLLEADRFNPLKTLTDVTPTLNLILQTWEKEKQIQFEIQTSKLHPQLLSILNEAAANIEFSPDEKKIMYVATASASIPQNLIVPPLARSTQKEEREIKPNRVYVYDIKEDKNFLIEEIPPKKDQKETLKFSWLPTSKHILIIQKDQISIKEYDGTNNTVIYNGPFENSFVFPFPSSTRLLILTTIGKNTPPNLYALTLR